jgi:hypothetical protein
MSASRIGAVPKTCTNVISVVPLSDLIFRSRPALPKVLVFVTCPVISRLRKLRGPNEIVSGCRVVFMESPAAMPEFAGNGGNQRYKSVKQARNGREKTAKLAKVSLKEKNPQENHSYKKIFFA